MRISVVAVVSLMVLAGCAGNAPRTYIGGGASASGAVPPQPKRDSYQELKDVSVKLVDSYAASVSEYLAKNSKKSAVEQAKKALAETLKDPSSAQFRNVRLTPYKDGNVICGEVNAKNSYGGYVGFKSFVAGVKGGQLAQSGGRYPDIDRAANEGLILACG